jgi:hypothetical protein
VARRNTRLLRKLPWGLRHAMPRLGFQRRRDGSFVFFPGPFSVTGAYAVPDDALEATAQAARLYRKRSQSLYALVIAVCVLPAAYFARALSIEISAAFDADRAAIETALRLAGLLLGLLACFILSRLRRQIFARRHLQDFAYLPDEARAVLFRPRRAYGPTDLRGAALGIATLAIAAWVLHLQGFQAAYAEAGRWALVVEAEILALVALGVAYCGFLLIHAGRVRRPGVAHAQARERWAEMEVATGWQRRGQRPPGPRPLIWRLLLPDFGSGDAARALERLWVVIVWSLLLSIPLSLLVAYAAGKL